MSEFPDHLAPHLDQAYASIIATIVDTGTCPHFTDVAATLGVSPEDGKAIVHQLMAVTPGWAHPGTDYIASFPPFNVQPTQYRIQIGERHGWFGQ